MSVMETPTEPVQRHDENPRLGARTVLKVGLITALWLQIPIHLLVRDQTEKSFWSAMAIGVLITAVGLFVAEQFGTVGAVGTGLFVLGLTSAGSLVVAEIMVRTSIPASDSTLAWWVGLIAAAVAVAITVALATVLRYDAFTFIAFSVCVVGVMATLILATTVARDIEHARTDTVASAAV